MKIQFAYRFTGENEKELIGILKKISGIFEKRGYEVYCPVLDSNRPADKKELFIGTIKKIDDADVLLALIKSDEKSEGMLLEMGYAFGRGKKVICAIQEDVRHTHMRELADKVVEYEDTNDLYDRLEEAEI